MLSKQPAKLPRKQDKHKTLRPIDLVEMVEILSNLDLDPEFG
jgi:hypothetical protein